MKGNNLIHHRGSGLTLLEIVIAILVAGILSAMLFQFMGTSLTGSSAPVLQVDESADNEGILETILADYLKEINSNPDTALENIKTKCRNNDYGLNVRVSFIQFDQNGNELFAETGNTLKVSIDGTSDTRSVILTKSRSADDPALTY